LRLLHFGVELRLVLFNSLILAGGEFWGQKGTHGRLVTTYLCSQNNNVTVFPTNTFVAAQMHAMAGDQRHVPTPKSYASHLHINFDIQNVNQ
jgi:hypothetical protein